MSAPKIRNCPPILDLPDNSAYEHTIKNPSYPKFNENEEIPHEEAAKVRMRLEFRKKLNSLTIPHHPEQEYCKDCKTLPSSPEAVHSSIVSVRKTSTTSTQGAKPKVLHKSTIGHEVRSYGISSESAEYLKAHPEVRESYISPQRIPHYDLGNVMAAFTNLHVAHEIAINHCYRLEKVKPGFKIPDRVKDINDSFKQILWDKLEREVQSDNTNYGQVLAVIEDLKQLLFSLMMPHNYELRDQVNEVLDLRRLEAETKKNPFDYHCYLPYILEVLGKICCPSRDAQIKAVQQTENPVEQIQGIYELMADMQDDISNFFISLFRPTIVKGSIENERKKFADYLELEYRLREDGLRATRAWLMGHRMGVRDTSTIVAKAFGEVLGWSYQHSWPETLLEDFSRLQKLQKSLSRIGIIGAVVMELGRIGHRIVKTPPAKLSHVFGRYLKALIPDEEGGVSEAKLRESLETAAEKAVEVMNKVVFKYLSRPMTPKEENETRDAVLSVVSPEHNFRHLIHRRTIDYAEEVILAGKDYHTPVPSTLSAVMYETAILVNEFYRVVLYNRACFDELYTDIVTEKNCVPLFPDQNDWNWDATLLDTLRKLRSRIATPDEAVLLQESFLLDKNQDGFALPDEEEETERIRRVSSRMYYGRDVLPPDNPNDGGALPEIPSYKRTKSMDVLDRYKLTSQNSLQNKSKEGRSCHDYSSQQEDQLQQNQKLLFNRFCNKCKCNPIEKKN